MSPADTPPEFRGFDTFTTMELKRDRRMAEVGAKMGTKYVGPIAPQAFLDKYLPSTQAIVELNEESKEALSKVGRVKHQVAMYPLMINALEGLRSNSLEFVDTHAHPYNFVWGHQPDLIKPDITAYSKPSKRRRLNDITLAEVFMEFKLDEKSDGFHDDSAVPMGGGERPSFEKETDTA
ncbi:hypothetical protein E1B28_009319 [Marasmius oreades]|uniref:Uncharacterized protein n=1 Tax=Marasmius oreades TaxID=181124 RepID=A0A9P7S0R8_9AGAR|nr:uncharacterized protein E1B28_009319 [Marasmius oreades]KAG7093023.1 hypothetical protein E1B28_009319 [Marasmius oreades]